MDKTTKNNKLIQSPKNVRLIIGLMVVTTLIVGIGVYSWQRSVLKTTEQSLQQQITLLKNQIKKLQQKQTSLNNESEIILKDNQQDNSKTDVYLKNIDSGNEKFFMTLTDVYSQHYHNSEHHNGNSYIIRRVGYDGYPDETWSDELWKYNTEKIGTKIYSGKGIDFRVAPNEKYIAIRDEGLRIVDQNNSVVQTYMLNSLEIDNNQDLQIGLLKWSDDSNQFWGDLSFTAYPKTLYKIDVNSWSVNKYDVSELGFSGDYDLNSNNANLAYSYYPTMFEINAYQEYNQSGEEVNLVIYDLKTKTQKQIATSITKAFDPKWISNNTLEYNDPNSDNRIQKIIE